VLILLGNGLGDHARGEAGEERHPRADRRAQIGRDRRDCACRRALRDSLPGGAPVPLDSSRRLLDAATMIRSIPVLSLALLASPLLVACGGSGDPIPPVEDAGTKPNEVRFDTSTYTLKPGEERRYMCYTTRLPGDAATLVKQVAPIYGKATHHLGIYYTIAAEPDGEFECPELVRETWIPLYGGGVESGTLKAPDGAAFHLLPKQQILVQLHLLNAGAETIEDKATIVLETSTDTTLKKAGMFGFDDRDLNIPAHSKGVAQGMSCPNVGVDMDVFAVFGHMHQHGKTIQVTRGAAPGAEVLYQDGWNFDNQPTVPKSFHVSAKDTINIGCTYDNDGDADLHYGESTANEMCSFAFYYTPYEALDGCLKAPPAP
jgi:hypothetical protein